MLTEPMRRGALRCWSRVWRVTWTRRRCCVTAGPRSIAPCLTVVRLFTARAHAAALPQRGSVSIMEPTSTGRCGMVLRLCSRPAAITTLTLRRYSSPEARGSIERSKWRDAAVGGLSEWPRRRGAVLTRPRRNCDVTTEHGATPLWIVCQNGVADAVRYCIQRGADVERVDSHGRSPLFMTCRNGHVDACRLCLDGGAEVDRSTPDGWSPVHIACFFGHPDAVRLCLERGAIQGVVTGIG